jgi:hypothetical protein
MPQSEVGHFPNRYYEDSAGNIHLNGSQLYFDENGSVLDVPVVLLLSGSADATPSHLASINLINRAGVDAITLAAPTAGVDDGTVIEYTSNTAFAHTVTCSAGVLQTGTAANTKATFAAFAGASLRLIACQGKWNVSSSNAVTFS